MGFCCGINRTKFKLQSSSAAFSQLNRPSPHPLPLYTKEQRKHSVKSLFSHSRGKTNSLGFRRTRGRVGLLHTTDSYRWRNFIFRWTIPLNSSFPSAGGNPFQGHPSEHLTLVTTFCCSPDCSSNRHSEHMHAVPLLPSVAAASSFPDAIRSKISQAELVLFWSRRTHFLTGWPSRKWSENWLNEMRNAGIHVKATKRRWYLPNPPRTGRTTVSTCESRLCGSDCDTLPFSAGDGLSSSSWTASIARRFARRVFFVSKSHSHTPRFGVNPVWTEPTSNPSYDNPAGAMMRKEPHKVFVEPGGHNAITALQDAQICASVPGVLQQVRR